MKQAIKNWLFKEELKEIKDIRDDLMNFPTHDQVNDVVEGGIESAMFITESDMEEQLSDVITECDLYSSLSSNNVVFHDDIEELVTEDQVDEVVTNVVSAAVDRIEWSEIIGEEVNRVFNARAESIVKQVLKDIPGYFMYEQIKRYVEEDYVKWDHYSLNFDDLAAKVEDINDTIEHLEAFQAPGIDKAIFFANFKDAIRKLLDETDILPSDE